MLNNLKNEIRPLRLEPTAGWNESILVEVANLLQFQTDFLGDLQDLRKAYELNGTSIVNDDGKSVTFE